MPDTTAAGKAGRMDMPQAHHTAGRGCQVDESPAALGGVGTAMSPDHRLDSQPACAAWAGHAHRPTHRRPIVTRTTPPTAKQLTYLRALADRTGTTFVIPATRAQASAEIRRLTTIASTGFTFAELHAEHAARKAFDDHPLVKPWETTGYGSTATWSQRA
jgi:hypothetical protein